MESDSDADEFFDAPDSSEHENICCDSSKDKSENLAQTEEPVPDKDSVENSVLKSLTGSECDDSPSPRVAGTPDIDLLNHGQQAASQLSINGTDKKEVAMCGDLTVESATENAIPVVTVTDSQAALNLAMPGSSITGLDNENRLTNRFSMPVSVEDKFDGAPDIVQSTKSSSLNRQGKIKSPIAPPRRKKGPAPPIPVEALSRLPTTDVDVAGAVNHVLIQATGTDNVPLLDISIVTDGSVVVTANEDDSARAEQVSEDSLDAQVKIDDDDEDDQVLEEDVSSSCTSKTSSSLVTITFNVLNGSEDGEINKPVDGSRPRSSSGSRYLTDKEILEQSYVVNLDSGETVPLSLAEEKLPECINPLSLHIMRRTKEYSSDSSLKRQAAVSDDEALKETATLGQKPVKQTGKKRMKIKKFFGKTAHKLKTVADAFHVEENLSDDEDNPDGRSALKVKASHSHKGPYDFDLLVPVQELTSKSMEAVWTMKFSHCGQLLATGGQDNLLRVWVLKTAFSYFDDMRKKYTEAAAARASSSLDKQTPQSTVSEDSQSTASGSEFGSEDSNDVSGNLPFMPQPFCVYKGHTADLLDVSWSKNYFILSSSMDKTVRLWHVSRRECLCCFQHIDFVTAIAFHPKDDRYFLSGSLDGKLRLWNIPDKKVALWNEVEGVSKLITAANFCMNGRFAVVGTYDGRCVFYSAEHLKYHTQLNVRSSRGRNARGRKITGVEPFPGEDKILVTSNDSRIRLYDLRDLTLTCKFKGCTNNSSQIKASFSHDGRYIICGSEDRAIYIWKTQHDFYKFSSARRDRSDYWESVRAHTAVVTSAIFAPCPDVIIRSQSNFVVDNSGSEDDVSNCGIKGEVLVSADYNGAIRVFLNKFVPVESD